MHIGRLEEVLKLRAQGTAEWSRFALIIAEELGRLSGRTFEAELIDGDEPVPASNVPCAIRALAEGDRVVAYGRARCVGGCVAWRHAARGREDGGLAGYHLAFGVGLMGRGSALTEESTVTIERHYATHTQEGHPPNCVANDWRLNLSHRTATATPCLALEDLTHEIGYCLSDPESERLLAQMRELDGTDTYPSCRLSNDTVGRALRLLVRILGRKLAGT